MMNRPNASLLYLALVATGIVGSFSIPFMSVANGQPTQNNLMDLITEFGGSSETDDENMTIMGNEGTNMSSMPFNMGVFVMPMTCTSPNELLGLMSGMFGSANDANGMRGDNATQSMMMNMMRQQMMMPGKGMNGMGDGMMGMMGGNMTEAEMDHIMNMQICFPMMGEKDMDGMMGMMGK